MRNYFLLSVLALTACLYAEIPGYDRVDIGKWDMDSTFTTASRTWATDLSGNGNHLSLSDTSNSSVRYPTFTTGGGGYVGEALSFDGNDMAYTPYSTWGLQESVRIEMWFKATTDKAQTLLSVNAGYPWEIRLSSTAVTFFPWFMNTSDDTSAGNLSLTRAYSIGGWNHLVAEVLDGVISLTVNGGTSTRSYDPESLYMGDGGTRYVVMGCSQAGTRHFEGLIDEVTISTYSPIVYPDYYYPYEDAYGTYMLWHMDEIFNQANRMLIADDDSADTGRDLNLTLMHNSGFSTPSSGSGPQIVPSFTSPIDVDFGNALSFNGLNDSARVDIPGNIGVDGGNFKVEAWVKMDDAVNTYGAGRRYYIVCHQPRFALYITDESSGWRINWSAWWSGGAFNLNRNYPDHKLWHHIAASWFEGEMRIYIDGIEVGYSKPTTTKTVSDSTATYLYVGGFDASNAERRFYGTLDEVRISQAIEADPECGYWGYHPADLNQDCYVNLLDLKLMLENWMDCSIPNQPGCEQF